MADEKPVTRLVLLPYRRGGEGTDDGLLVNLDCVWALKHLSSS